MSLRPSAAGNGGLPLSVSDSLQPCLPFSLLLDPPSAPSSPIPGHSSRNASSSGQVGLPPLSSSFDTLLPPRIRRFPSLPSTFSLMASPTKASHTQTHLSPGSPPSPLYRASLPAVVRLSFPLKFQILSRTSLADTCLAPCACHPPGGVGHAPSPPPDARPAALVDPVSLAVRLRNVASPPGPKPHIPTPTRPKPLPAVSCSRI